MPMSAVRVNRLILPALTLALGAAVGCSRASSAPHIPAEDVTESHAGLNIADIQGPMSLIVTPNEDGHPEFVQAIQAAQSSIRMVMFHLSDPQAIDALVQAAQRGVDVKVILDGASLRGEGAQEVFARLSRGGVDVRASSPGFSLTHEKSMVIDGTTAFITSINLTQNAGKTRDLGVIVSDGSILREVLSVFDADWENAANRTANTPPLTNPNLVWSPVNARTKLIALIDSARSDIVSTVENLGDREIERAFARAASRHVSVRLITPMCDKAPNPLLNYPHLKNLARAGVAVRVMTIPESASHPYMHSKMILVDGKRAYVGSVNFSFNSTTRARELGIIFSRARLAEEIARIFNADWAASVAPPDPLMSSCPAMD